MRTEIDLGSTSAVSRAKHFLRRLRDYPGVLKVLVSLLGVARSLGFLRSRNVYSHVPFRGVVRVACGDGRAFRIRSHGHNIENGLYWEGVFAHEPASMRVWISRARKADVVLDIGANSGVFALAASAAGARSVHAFEPLPRVYRILSENLALNENLHIVAWPIAIGASDGEADLFDPGGDAPTSASLSVDFAKANFGELPAVRIAVRSIDSICLELGIKRVDLIKIDVEGYEEPALRGMREVVAESLPDLMMEVLPGQEEKLKAVVDELWPGLYEWRQIEEGDGHISRNVMMTLREGVGRFP